MPVTSPPAVFTRRRFLSGTAALAAVSMLPTRRARGAVHELDFASAVDAANAVRRGDISSVELTTRMLDRIRQHNPRINAVVTVDGDRALARAKAADEARARNEWWGAFHGVPCTIKDTFEVAGVRTTAGSPTLSNHVPARDSAVAARMRAAGAVILGKTNVPTWASDWQSRNEVFGVSNNPWDVSRTPGGSTGGGAAALAAGLSYVEPGSDIGGSIRVPAHFCGVYGHKPTLNVVSLRGHIPPPPGIPAGTPTLPVAGPLARSAADLLAALQVLGGPDGDDARAYRWTLPAPRGTRLADYRIGYVLDDPRCPVSSEVGDVLAQAVEALKKNGARLEEGWPKGVTPAAQYDVYQFLLYSAFAFDIRDDQLDELRKQAASPDSSYGTIQARAFSAPHRDFMAASGRRMAARAVWQEYFRTHDAFLLPTAFVPAFPHDGSPQNMRVLATAKGPRPYFDLLFWISFATLTGLPATTAPVGFTRDGLPVGIQIMGPWLEDATPIDLAGKLADVVGGFKPPKGF